MSDSFLHLDGYLERIGYDGSLAVLQSPYSQLRIVL